MAGNWDATVTVLRATETGKNFVAATVQNGKEFDVVVEVEAGARIMEFATRHDVVVSVLNVSAGTVLARLPFGEPLTPATAALHRSLRLSVPAGWIAQEGDVLEVVASYKLTAGLHPNASSARSGDFIVTA